MQDRFICPEGVSGRADKILADYYQDFSRAFIKQSMEHGKITFADGSAIQPKSKISSGDEILVLLVRPQKDDLQPYRYNLHILYEDDHVLVINKETGMVVHPGDGTDDKTLVHALLHHCSDHLSPVGSPLRPGIVHRLDKDTSGVMVVAKSEFSHLSLVDQFAKRKTSKKYQAIICRKLIGQGEYRQPIGRHSTVRVKMAVSDKGKPAWTKWRNLMNFGDDYTLVECDIMTGRTHQIRVHFSAAGHPLAGDKTYGYKPTKGMEGVFSRVMLHAFKLCFNHPTTDERMEFIAPLPKDFAQCLKKLKSDL